MYGGHVRSVGTALWHARQARESINRAGRDVNESKSWLREEQYTTIKRVLDEARETLLHVVEVLKSQKEARREGEDDAPADHGFTDPWAAVDYHELYPIHETAHEVVRPSKAPKLSIRPSHAN